MDNIVFAIARSLLYVLLIVGLGEIIRIDIELGNFGEESITEWFQQTILALMVLIALSLQFYTSNKLLLRGIAVVSLVLLIREFNNFFIDNFFKNAWQTLILLVIIPASIYFFKHRKVLEQEIKIVKSHCAVGIIFSGALVLFLFSRLYGRKLLWMTLMAENYDRKLKDVAEESIESLGYALLFIGTLELMLFIRKIKL